MSGRGAFRRRMGISVDQPSCAGCGYPVRGLPSFICPECGCDLREVGIVTPSRYIPGLKLFFSALWIGMRAGFAAGLNAYRVVWRGGRIAQRERARENEATSGTGRTASA
ncbi:MAG TPA: hypothetical protein VH518_14030 [Tepidisphaeraceae bacterium]|jgi:hypothetical protein